MADLDITTVVSASRGHGHGSLGTGRAAGAQQQETDHSRFREGRRPTRPLRKAGSRFRTARSGWESSDSASASSGRPSVSRTIRTWRSPRSAI